MHLHSISRLSSVRSLVVAIAVLSSLSFTASIARSAVYQWSSVIESLTKDNIHPRGYLWIPENCQRVRAIVIAVQNMEESQILEDAGFRKTLSSLGFAEIWIAPGTGSLDFRFDQDAAMLETLLSTLADQSAYSELKTVPLVPMGHSAMASWGWDMAAWNPQRVLAVLSVSGQWPYFTSKDWGDHNLDGVPGLTTKGEYEIEGSLESGWYAGLRGDSYTKHPNQAFTQVVEPGDGHFSASAEKIKLIGMYLEKAAKYRLPPASESDGPAQLRPIDATHEGWLFDVWHLKTKAASPAALVASYRGKKDNAFWAFDEEMARAIEKFQTPSFGNTPVLIGYQQKAGLTLPVQDHAMVHLKFEPIDDGITLKLTAGFWDRVPPTKEGNGSAWLGWLNENGRKLTQNDPIPHPTRDPQALSILPICGPVLQTAPGLFKIRWNRTAFDNPTRANDIWLFETFAGDRQFKRMVQQAELQFPASNSNGATQQIDFPKIADQHVGASVQLTAAASSHLPVHYFIREGPAEVDDAGKLTITAIPPRAKYPIPITVVAWQWGRSIAPLVQSAKSVDQAFMVTAQQ